MHLRAPHVPPAAQLAEAGTQGPRVPPGQYTIRMQKNAQTYDTSLSVGLDSRVSWSVADRQAQFDAAQQVSVLFNDESALFAQIAALRSEVADSIKQRSAGDQALRPLAQLDAKLDALRKQIVATKEGGAITGEERLREHTDQLYGAITSWDGPPAQYQLENAAALRAQLTELTAQYAQLTAGELPELNRLLKSEGGQPLAVPAQVAFDDQVGGSGGVGHAARGDADDALDQQLPKDLRLWN
jgi:hypothetical protein